VQRLCRDLLGPTAIAEHETKSGRCLTVIGYTIVLDRKLVLYAFMSVDENGVVTVKTVQKLASLGFRYGKVCRFLRPFVRFLYRIYKGSGDHASVLLEDLAKLVIRLFRTILVLGSYAGEAQEHLEGAKNHRADSRSRGGTLADRGLAWEHLPELDLAPGEVLRLCSPEWKLATDEAFCAYIQQIKEVIRGVPKKCKFLSSECHMVGSQMHGRS
jgi:hypothetical protein